MLDHGKSKGIPPPPKNGLLLHWLCKSLWRCGSQWTGIFLMRWGYQTTLPASWETCMHDKKQLLELDMEQWTGSQLGKGVHQGCILSPYLLNLYAEYIMWNAGLDESQTGIKTVGEIPITSRYPDDTTLMAASEEDLKGFVMKVKEESEKAGLKFNIQKVKIMSSVLSLHCK